MGVHRMLISCSKVGLYLQNKKTVLIYRLFLTDYERGYEQFFNTYPQQVLEEKITGY